MPIPTPGVATYHATIDLPAGSDAPTRASIADPLEQLADRTRHIVTNFAYIGENPRQVTFGPVGGSSGSLCLDTSTTLLAPVSLDDGWRPHSDATTGLSKGYVRCGKFGTDYLFDLTPHLRTGMVLTSLLVYVKPGFAMATIADRITARVTYTIPGIDGETSINSAYVDGTSAAQTITVPLLSEVVTRVSRYYMVHVTSSQSSQDYPDEIRGFALVFTEPAGMGPRNY